MSKQEKLIGTHPDKSKQFGRWLSSRDLPTSISKCHRELTEAIQRDTELIDWLAKITVKHHHSDFRLKRLKKHFDSLNYKEYAKQNKRLPSTDNTKKGNLTEIILTEYIQSTLNKKLIKIFKFMYNPNADQAIKGDDVLMIDLITEAGEEKIKIYLGEAKFRSTPNKNAVEEITNSLDTDKLPLSYTFLVEEIAKTDDRLAEKLDKYIVQEIKNKGNLIYTGLLLSNRNTSTIVEKHLNSNNANLLFISIGIDNPEDFINDVFDKAEEILDTGIKEL